MSIIERLDISVVIPLFNEEESLKELAEWIAKVMVDGNYSYEVLFIDDGSTDTSWSIVEKLSVANSNIKGIKFRRNYGKSGALHIGFQETKGDVVITMDADLQDSPDEIPELYDLIMKEGYDLISGWKKERFDPITKTIPTKLFNWATRKLSGIELNDFNCGLKSYRGTVVRSIEVYGEMHRYIPVIAKRGGFTKIGEKVVKHYPRKYGVTKFGLERFINGFLDLLSITFVTKYGKKPMHFFGLFGTLMFFIGFMITGFLGAEKLYYVINHESLRLVTDSPMFYISLVMMILGTQMFLAGFLGEMISRSSSDRNQYQIEAQTNID
ncbi:MAG: glycosyltransferase involved in cell wall biosynthesis [Salibacteraceae bacterium]|jgi:glycosyltransferase involved in cell wall biosynthesis